MPWQKPVSLRPDLFDRFFWLRRSSFVGDVAKLSFGTLGGRLVMIAALPVITRLYSPGDFALLSVYLAIVNTVAVAACFRLEIAIPLAGSTGDAANLLGLSLVAALIVATVVAVPALIVPERVAGMLGQPALAPYLWMVPLTILVAAGYSALQYWATRARRFGTIARTRVAQSVSGVTVILGLGWVGIAPFGLLLGNFLNIGGGVVRLAAEARLRDRDTLRTVSMAGMRDALRTYRRYPLYSTPEAIANVAGLQVPIILIASLADAEAGFLLLAMQAMFVPMRLLGSSVSQVYMSRAPEELAAERLAPFTLGIMRRLVQIGVGPLVFASIVAPTLFPLIFGPEWARSGEIVAWIVPWIALQFIVSPVSMAIFVRGWQSVMLALTLFGLVARLGSVGAASALAGSGALVPALMAGSAVYYLAVLATVMSAAEFGRKDVLALGRSFWSWTIPASVAVGVAVVVGVEWLR